MQCTQICTDRVIPLYPGTLFEGGGLINSINCISYMMYVHNTSNNLFIPHFFKCICPYQQSFTHLSLFLMHECPFQLDIFSLLSLSLYLSPFLSLSLSLVLSLSLNYFSKLIHVCPSALTQHKYHAHVHPHTHSHEQAHANICLTHTRHANAGKHTHARHAHMCQ